MDIVPIWYKKFKQFKKKCVLYKYNLNTCDIKDGLVNSPHGYLESVNHPPFLGTHFTESFPLRTQPNFRLSKG